MRTLRVQLGLIAAAATLVVAGHAEAADWKVKGRGFGHGVGMSQYGALGFAKSGYSYQDILHHYYTGVEIARTTTKSVRVLIGSDMPSFEITRADAACGESLDPRQSYSFRLESGAVSLRRANGSELTGCGQQGIATGSGPLVLKGVGVYRGDLRARNVGGSLYAINQVGIEEYLQGVVPNESFPSWPQAALRAQAVAARSYALATRVNGDGYDLYDDNRSQVYGGVSSEEASTNEAVGETASEVITSGGVVVPGYFFSSSGGQTENSEYGFTPTGTPRAYLKGVPDPFDDVSPSHRWRFRLSQGEMEAKLAGLFSGKLKRVAVRKRGVSPRIVKARVVGSAGSSVVSGATLQYRLGLRSTWAKFKKLR